MSKYLDLAKAQFLALKEEVLDEDRKALGSGSEETHTVDGSIVTISVDGFWEKATWFDYSVKNESGEEIESGDYMF